MLFLLKKIKIFKAAIMNAYNAPKGMRWILFRWTFRINKSN